MSEEPEDSKQNQSPADQQSDGHQQDGQSQDGPPRSQQPNQPQGGQQPNQPQSQQPNQPQGGRQPNQPQGGQPQGQPNQPQGGQPQSQPRGQPQGGQPQSQPRGQPQGGQSQGQPRGQPQGGQPQSQPRGQPQGQPRGQPQGQVRGQQRRGQAPASQIQTNLDIDTAYLQEWVVYFIALFAAGGVGLGLRWVLFSVIDQSIFDVSGLGGVGSALGATAVVITMFMLLSVVAVFIGAWFGQTLQEPDQETFVIAGGSVGAGAAVFFLVVSLLLSIGLDGISPNIVGIVLNLILTTIFVGAIAAGGAAVTRNLAPRDL